MTSLDPPLGHFVDPLIARFYRYWDERRQGRWAPARADIDPVDFAYVLADVTLIDVAGDPPRFRYRIVGHNLAQREILSMAGRWLDEMPEPHFRDRLRRSFLSVVRTRVPRHGVRNITLDGRRRHYEFLILPLSNSGEQVDMLITAQRYLR
jgi:hypothetical protein